MGAGMVDREYLGLWQKLSHTHIPFHLKWNDLITQKEKKIISKIKFFFFLNKTVEEIPSLNNLTTALFIPKTIPKKGASTKFVFNS